MTYPLVSRPVSMPLLRKGVSLALYLSPSMILDLGLGRLPLLLLFLLVLLDLLGVELLY